MSRRGERQKLIRWWRCDTSRTRLWTADLGQSKGEDMDSILKDNRLGILGLMKGRSLTIALITLGLGLVIGISLFNMFLAPKTIKDPSSVVQIECQEHGARFSFAEYEFLPAREGA